MNYIPLNIKTEYDLMNSLIRIDDIILYAKSTNLTALGITDTNMFGALEFINKCKTNTIIMDITRIKRVFSNIISNSIRYIDEKGIIKIEITEDEKNFIFKVIDNGKGTNDENIEKMFDPLFTTDKSRKIAGLGLSICKEIVESHDGYIKDYNNKTSGLTIEFSINKNLNKS